MSPAPPSSRAAWSLLGGLTGLAERLRAAAEALGDTAEIESGWLRGAAELVERGEPERRAVRTDAVWLEELAPEARARKAALLSAWVDAAEALRTAIHALESERGPLDESLFPLWRPPSLRRHADQARAAETELQRRLSSAYVARRLAELATHAALGTALEALAGAGAAWAAERDRPALAGPEADTVRARLLALAGQTTRLLERVRWIVRAALADRPELVDGVFPKRARPVDAPGPAAGAEAPGAGAGAPAGVETPAARLPAGEALAAEPSPGPSPDAEAETRPTARSRRGRRAPAAEAEPTPAALPAPAFAEGTSRTSGPRSRRTPHASPGAGAGRVAPSEESRAKSTSTRRAAPAAVGGAPGRAASGATRRGAAATGSAPAPGKARPPPGRGAGRRPRPARRS